MNLSQHDRSFEWKVLGNTGRGESRPITIAEAETRCAVRKDLAIEEIHGERYLVRVLPDGPTEPNEYREVIACIVEAEKQN
jgi:hypothetical protein